MILIFNGAIHAQETTLSAGNESSSPSGTVHYSIDQITYTTNSGINGSSAQGVQQPFEIMEVAGVEIKEIQLELSAYRNPATHFSTLKVENYTQKNSTFKLAALLYCYCASNNPSMSLPGKQSEELFSRSFIFSKMVTADFLYF